MKLEKNNYIDFHLTNIHLDITPLIQNDKLVMKTYMTSEAHIQSSTREVDLTSKEVSNQLETKLNDHLKRQMEKTLHKIFSNYQIDVICLGAAFHRKYPQEWKGMEDNWHTLLGSIELVMHTNVHITKSGLLIDGILKKEEFHGQ